MRVPYADVAPVKIPEGLTDEQVLFLGDIFPTGWQAAAQCDIQPTDTVAVWGAGPVGQFAIRSAVMLGAAQVICIDNVPERLDMARAGGAVTIDFDEESVLDRLQELTGGKGPDKCIEAVGMEAHCPALDRLDGRPRQAVGDARERPAARAARNDVRLPPGRRRSRSPGVYGGMVDKIPFGAVMNKGLTIKHRPDARQALDRRAAAAHRDGQIDPSFVITHSVAARGRARHVQDLSRQGGRLHQGRPEAMSRARHHSAQGVPMSNHSIQHPLSRALPSRPQGRCGSPARALGWFSIAVGLAELAMPRRWPGSPARRTCRR